MARRSSTRSSTARACCAPQVEDALAELVARGLVTADSFAGLRALLVPSDRSAARSAAAAAAAHRAVRHRGRGPLVARAAQAVPSAGDRQPAGPGRVEHIARTLLRRYGVVFWRLLEREAGVAAAVARPAARACRRLEARGEIRGGRFVAGVSGEQFALPEAVGLLREVRRREPDGALAEPVRRRSAQPRRRAGPGRAVPALTATACSTATASPLALLVGGDVRFIEPLPPDEEWTARNALLRRQVPATLRLLG